MNKETIHINNNESYDIEVAPLTIVCPAANFMAGIKYEGRLSISSTDTIYHAQRVNVLHGDFAKAWMVFMDNTNPKTVVDYEINAANIRKMGMGAVHLMGLIDLILKLKDKNIKTAIIHPESHMHPGWQVALGDLFIHFMREK